MSVLLQFFRKTDMTLLYSIVYSPLYLRNFFISFSFASLYGG